METLQFRGSHGHVTACAVSGHVIHADACECEDCQRFGDYRSIALVDVSGTDPDALKHGGGDILFAALIWRGGGYSPACVRVEFGDCLILDELPRLPAPDGKPVPVHDWHDADGAWIGLGTAREFQHWRAEGVLPADSYLGRVGCFDLAAADAQREAAWARDAASRSRREG
jgi:hypothetical protein